MGREPSTSLSVGPEVPVRTRAISARASITITFLAFGIAVGVGSGATAALIARTAISAAAFGVGLTIYTCVYLLAMSSAATLARMAGLRRVVIASALLECPTLLLTLTASTGRELLGAVALFALAAGALDATMNAQGAALERTMRRPIMARFHGAASAGMATGALLGSWLVGGPHPWIAALIATVALCAAAAAVAIAAPPESERPVGGSARLDAKVLTGPIVALGVVVGVSIACETSALQWSAPLLRGEAPDLAAIAGLGGTFFAGCQAMLRLNADFFRARFADRTLIALSLGLAALGLGVVALPLGFFVSALGFAVVGLGTASIVPCGFALAGTRPGVSSAASISAVAFFGLFARAPAPLVTGAIADALSLSTAFLAIAGLMLVALIAVLVFIPASEKNARGNAS